MNMEGEDKRNKMYKYRRREDDKADEMTKKQAAEPERLNLMDNGSKTKMMTRSIK